MSYYTSTHYLFRSLSDADVLDFQQYAQLHDPSKLADWPIVHPVCRAEWRRLGKVGAEYPIDEHEQSAREQVKIER